MRKAGDVRLAPAATHCAHWANPLQHKENPTHKRNSTDIFCCKIAVVTIWFTEGYGNTGCGVFQMGGAELE